MEIQCLRRMAETLAGVGDETRPQAPAWPIRGWVYGSSMAARQRETRHTLEDGFVVAWDSSEFDERLRDELIELASEPIGGIIIGMGSSEGTAPAGSSAPRRRKAARHRRAAA